MRGAVVLLVMLLADCDGAGNPIDPEEGAPGGGLLGGAPIDQSATFTRVQNEIFTPSCGTLACHDPLGQQSGFGERMPLLQQPPSENQIALVRNWIRRGAPNDESDRLVRRSRRISTTKSTKVLA